MQSDYFAQIYADVPAEQIEMLLAFRTRHFYRELALPGPGWCYLACGRGDQCLLFLPGGFLSADMWFYPISKLENDYRILAPDSYVHYGISGLQAVSDGLIQLLNQEKVERATLIGLSAGGGIAQYFLQEHPDRVAHVVLSHCGILQQDQKLAKRTRRIGTLARFMPQGLTRTLIQRLTSSEKPVSSEWTNFEAAYFTEARERVTRAMVVGFLEDAADFRGSFEEKPEELQSWPGTVFILSSEDDPLSFSAVADLQARYPRVETHIFPVGGHHTLFFFPEAYVQALANFLDSVRPW